MSKLRLFPAKIRSLLGGKPVESQAADPNPARKRETGQSFVEMALIVPILLLMVLGLVEVALFVGRYLDMLDLTREAARFASVHDPFQSRGTTPDCATPETYFNYYFNTACIFSPRADTGYCRAADFCPDDGHGGHTECFCGGMNPYLVFDPTRDDVVISVYTVTKADDGTGTGVVKDIVTNVWPTDKGYWALSNRTNDPTKDNEENWKKDCNGVVDFTKKPHFTREVINSMLDESAPPSKGFVAVEFYYCYDQALNAPIITDLIPNPLRLNAYTLMPVPEAAPTPTAIP